MFLIFFSFLFFFGMGIRIINRIHLENMRSKCEIHSWQYYNKQMVCDICKKTPEEIQRGYND